MPETGLRERKKVATRRALIDAATRLAVERGPDRVTVDDIAAEAGVSVRTFFNYFTAKEDAVIGVDPERAQALVDALATRPPDEPPLASLRAVFLGTLHRYTDEREAWGLRAGLLRQWPHLQARQAAQFEPVERRLVEVIAERVGADPDTDLYPTLVVTLAAGALRTALRMWQATGTSTSLEHLAAEALDALAAGLPQPRRTRRRTRTT